MSARIAFFGLGNMGEPMASHLVRKGFGVTVVGHRRREPVERLIALGATEAAQAKDAARDAGVAVLMLPGSDEVDALAFGPEGLLASMRAGAVLLDCSASDPGRSAALARAAHRAERSTAARTTESGDGRGGHTSSTIWMSLPSFCWTSTLPSGLRWWYEPS